MKVLHTVHISGEATDARQHIIAVEHDDLFKLYCDFNQVDEDEAERAEMRKTISKLGGGVFMTPLGIFNIDPSYLESYIVLESDTPSVHVM
ncbi:hypothetical protein D3C75_503360 [compost metagenome]